MKLIKEKVDECREHIRHGLRWFDNLSPEEKNKKIFGLSLYDEYPNILLEEIMYKLVGADEVHRYYEEQMSLDGNRN